MANFAFLGVGGYIAPRHFEAINKTGNRTVLACDPNDSVGILDRYTQDVQFYTDFERFQSCWDDYKNTDKAIDWLTICSPNYMHHPQMKFGLSQGANIICEKPLVLEEKEIDQLQNYEQKFNKKVNTVLQLRVHDALIALKEQIATDSRKDKYKVDLTYLTSRGPWYHESWKGDVKKSGGLATNIGIHFFDMLAWIFGEVESNELHYRNDHLVSGFMRLEKADVTWALSVDRKYLPKEAVASGKSTYRSISVDGKEIEFSEGFTDLHNKVYEQALAGKGYGLEAARSAIKLVEKMRFTDPLGVKDYSHPVLRGL